MNQSPIQLQLLPCLFSAGILTTAAVLFVFWRRVSTRFKEDLRQPFKAGMHLVLFIGVLCAGMAHKVGANQLSTLLPSA